MSDYALVCSSNVFVHAIDLGTPPSELYHVMPQWTTCEPHASRERQ